MRDLQKKGYESKEALNIKKDSDKLKDLDYLKNQDIRGPFSTVEEVRAFISSDIAKKNKCDRLYIEIRYAKSTCLSMNTKSLNNFFKLRKKGRKLESHVYAKCLENCFEISRTIEHVTIPDLQKTLGEIQNNIFNNNEVVKSVSNQNTGLDLVIGEHIAVFFIDGNKYIWQLAIVDNLRNDDISVSLFSHLRKRKENWTLSDEIDIKIVNKEQILKCKVPVIYKKTNRIQFSIEKQTVEEIELEFDKVLLKNKM